MTAKRQEAAAGAKRNGVLRVAAVGDLHVGAETGPDLRDLFEQISASADAVALCGDLTNTGLPEEATAFAAALANLRIPAVAVLGNHDHHAGQVDELRRILREQSPLHLVDDVPFELDGVAFVGAKGFAGGFGAYTLDCFGEEATKAFVNEAVSETLRLEHAMRSVAAIERRVVVLHYAPVVETVVGEPTEIYPFLGCSRLAEAIDRFGATVVFHGHAHAGSLEGTTPRGARVYNCCLPLLEQKRGTSFVVVEV